MSTSVDYPPGHSTLGQNASTVQKLLCLGSQVWYDGAGSQPALVSTMQSRLSNVNEHSGRYHIRL